MIIRTMIIMFAALILLAAVVSVHQPREKNTNLLNFLNLTDYRANIFIYKNSNGNSYAVAIFDDGRLSMESGNHMPLLAFEEIYKGVKIKVSGDKAWTVLNGITVYGNKKLVEKAIDAAISGKNLYKFLQCKKIVPSDLHGSVYLCILKGNYCPYCSKLKVVYAAKEEGGYCVKIYFNGAWSTGWLKNIEDIGRYITGTRKILEITASNYNIKFRSLNIEELQALKAQA